MTNKNMKFVAFLVLGLIILNTLLTACGGTITNYVYEPKAGSMKWVTIDGEDFNPNIDNVAPMSTYGASTILAQTLSSEGNPYLFVDNGYRKKCIRWNGTKWVNLDGNPWYSATKYCSNLIQRDHSNLSMKLDSNNNPHLIWSEDISDEYSSSTEIFYARWDNDKWVTVSGEEFDYESGNGNVSKNEKMCKAVTPSFALDSKNIPHIVWVSYDPDDNSSSRYRLINYVTWNGKTWINSEGKEYLSNSVSKSLVRSFSNAEISGDFHAENPMILIDSKNNPCIIWNYYESNSEHCYMHTNQGVFIKKFDGDWVGIDEWMWDPYLGGSGRLSYKFCDFGSLNHFDLDSHDSPYLVWADIVEPGDLQISLIKGVDSYWKTLHNEKWGFLHDSDSMLDLFKIRLTDLNFNFDPIIKIDSSDNIHLLWYNKKYDKDILKSYIFYGKWDGENWRTIDGQLFDMSSKNYGLVVATRAARPYTGILMEMELFVDDNGIPHIFWYGSDRYHCDLDYIRGAPVE